MSDQQTAARQTTKDTRARDMRLPLGDRTIASDAHAALKAIRRWCDNRHVGNADVVRNVRLVCDDYLRRGGKDD